MLVALQLPVHLLQQHWVGDLAHVEAGLVHNGDDALKRLTVDKSAKLFI